MSRINRMSSLLRVNRLRTNYVNRMSHSNSIDRVEPLNPTEKGKNHSDHPTESFLDSYERYYQKIGELKKEFKRFYHREKELLEAISDLDDNKQRIVKHTHDLIEKYNQALLALADFDKIAGTHHTVYVRSVLDSFSEELNEIGVTEGDSGLLDFNPKTFVSFIAKDTETIEQTIKRFKSMILQNYKSLTKIRIAKEKQNPYEQKPFEYKGLFIEEES